VAGIVGPHAGSDASAFLNSLGGPGIGVTVGDVRKAAAEEFRFHIGLAQLAGNALLDLFLRIIVELFRRHWSSTGQAMPTRTDFVAVEHAHLRILEAIAEGDDSLARYRIRRHLDAAASWWL